MKQFNHALACDAKQVFLSASAAWRTVQRRHRHHRERTNGPMQVYRCACGFYHLGHAPLRRKQRLARRGTPTWR